MRGLMFDLDGTLSNSVPLICRTSQLAFAELGLEFREKQVRDFIGRPLLEAGEAHLGPGRGQEYVDAYYRHYDARGLQAFPGAREMLEDLKAAGFSLAIVTSRRQDSTWESLKIIGLEGLFQQVVCFEDTCHHKPHPEPLRFCCGEIGVAPDQALYVGDSIYDIQCAEAAGLWSCGVTWGVAGEEMMKQANPVYLCHSMAQLHDRLLNINTGKHLPTMEDLLKR